MRRIFALLLAPLANATLRAEYDRTQKLNRALASRLAICSGIITKLIERPAPDRRPRPLVRFLDGPPPDAVTMFPPHTFVTIPTQCKLHKD